MIDILETENEGVRSLVAGRSKENFFLIVLGKDESISIYKIQNNHFRKENQIPNSKNDKNISNCRIFLFIK